MRRIKFGQYLGAFAIASLVPFPARAADKSSISTLETAARPIMRGGALAGCEIDFKTAYKDTVYRNGEISIANGSLIVYGFEGGKSLVLAIKLKLFDISGFGADLKQTPIAPSSVAVMVEANRSNRPSFINANPADDGGLITIFKFDDNFLLITESLLTKQRVTLTFNRRAGGSDIVLPIDLSVPDADGKAVVPAFNACLTTGMKSFQTPATK